MVYIARLIKEGAQDFGVRQTAINILLQNDVPPKDYLGEIRTLFACYWRPCAKPLGIRYV